MTRPGTTRLDPRVYTILPSQKLLRERLRAKQVSIGSSMAWRELDKALGRPATLTEVRHYLKRCDEQLILFGSSLDFFIGLCHPTRAENIDQALEIDSEFWDYLLGPAASERP